jgi:hypothetical protein
MAAAAARSSHTTCTGVFRRGFDLPVRHSAVAGIITIQAWLRVGKFKCQRLFLHESRQLEAVVVDAGSSGGGAPVFTAWFAAVTAAAAA